MPRCAARVRTCCARMRSWTAREFALNKPGNDPGFTGDGQASVAHRPHAGTLCLTAHVAAADARSSAASVTVERLQRARDAAASMRCLSSFRRGAQQVLFAQLPESAALAQAAARRRDASPARCAPHARSASAQTRAVLGVLRADASAFETLALAGRMLGSSRRAQPRRIALAAPGQDGVALRSRRSCPRPRAVVRAAAFRKPRPALAPSLDIDLIGAQRPDLEHVARQRARQQSGALAHRAAAQHARCARLSAHAHRARAPHGLAMRWLDEAD